jgi:hypothetical protein
MITKMKVRKLEKAGDLVRMFDDRNVKNLFLVQADGRIKAERP